MTDVDDWPSDAEMAEPCWCGHLLGQHAYGADPSPCDRVDCPCVGFDITARCPWCRGEGCARCGGTGRLWAKGHEPRSTSR